MAIFNETPILPFIVFIIIINIIYKPILCSGHQPFFPAEILPPASQPPRQQPKYPFSFTQQNPFFPLSLSPPLPPPPPPPTAAATFPANISSLTFSHHSPKPISRKLFAVTLTLSLSLLTSLIIIAAAVFLLRRRRRKTPPMETESRRLVPSDKAAPAPSANVSGEFLYLGTLRGIEENYNTKNSIFSSIATSSVRDYQRLSSPELRPLPPLPRHQPFSTEMFDHDEEEQFFSPILSPNNSNSNNKIYNINNNRSSPKVILSKDSLNLRNNSFSSSISSSPIDSMSSNSPFVALNLSTRTRSLNSNSPKLIKHDFRAKPIFKNESLSETHDSVFEKDRFLAKRQNLSVPSPPPLPPPRFWEMFETGKGQQVADNDLEREEKEEESDMKPRLKPLHWDKVRASSDRAMVWDQIKSSSFQLNEEMIETLFMVNGPGSSSSENTQRMNQENRLLDPKKSQNIAILLRALNVTVNEVCEALMEGTTDTLGTELLESLLKMAPSEEEKRKLKESKDDSPAKLNPAEKFLRTVVDIPFAFQRVDAMLYVSTFDSEVEYLKRSFHTLKAACEELKNSRMFRKLLDAVLQTGNRMNLGTERGDARAFKLDTLLNLVHIKGTDKKTSLLHFVVQEISRAEGSSNQGSTPVQCDAEFRKLGLRVVSGLSSELNNVKKSADMDFDVLGGDVAKLSNGVGKINDVLKVECGERFLGSMNEFLDRAEREIANVRSLERECSCSVKAITEFFHGESGKGDARIFKVVRDFVSILDCVCKEVGKVNDRGFVGSGLPESSTAFPIFREQC